MFGIGSKEVSLHIFSMISSVDIVIFFIFSHLLVIRARCLDYCTDGGTYSYLTSSKISII